MSATENEDKSEILMKAKNYFCLPGETKLSEKALNKYVRYTKVMQSLPKAQLDSYRESFQFFDRDNKGYIVAQDFYNALDRMGQNPTEEEAQDLLKTYDINGDGKVSFEELVVITVQRKENLVDKAELRKIFRKYDTDKDGVLNRDELQQALQSVGEKSLTKDVDEILEEFDTNHDGVIQFEEFMKMMAD